jgi:hypothetical protein
VASDLIKDQHKLATEGNSTVSGEFKLQSVSLNYVAIVQGRPHTSLYPAGGTCVLHSAFCTLAMLHRCLQP